jgi:protein-S-isoprenylcysteine O-methyltransferase Ste14
VWLVAIPLAYGLLPWALSLLTRRYGWAGDRPGPWNVPGLAGVAAGAVTLVWLVALALARVHELPPRVSLAERTPPYLFTGGPYRRTRNPMYLAFLAIWLGWAVWYGSPVLLAGLPALWLHVASRVRHEERDLEVRFGEAYLRYKRTVPRWLGRREGA